MFSRPTTEGVLNLLKVHQPLQQDFNPFRFDNVKCFEESNKFGIRSRPMTPHHKGPTRRSTFFPEPELNNIAKEVYDLFVGKQQSVADIALKLNLSCSTICSYLADASDSGLLVPWTRLKLRIEEENIVKEAVAKQLKLGEYPLQFNYPLHQFMETLPPGTVDFTDIKVIFSKMRWEQKQHQGAKKLLDSIPTQFAFAEQRQRCTSADRRRTSADRRRLDFPAIRGGAWQSKQQYIVKGAARSPKLCIGSEWAMHKGYIFAGGRQYRPKSGHQYIGTFHPQESAIGTGSCHPHRGTRPSSAKLQERCLTTENAQKTLRVEALDIVKSRRPNSGLGWRRINQIPRF
jgi:hypothetical protein